MTSLRERQKRVGPLLELTFGVAGLCPFVACAPIVVEAFESPDSGGQIISLVDRCPDDSAKSEPGVCGCGLPDDDFDGDGTLDCLDECPDNAGRTSPMGTCGCSALDETFTCAELRDALRNLYTFDGTGTAVIDSVSGRDGTVLHVQETTPPADLERLQQHGRLNFDGVGSYVDLPDGMISSLTSATFEAWISWRGGALWARIFDFGNNDGGAPADAVTYIFLTPSTTTNNNPLRVAVSLAGPLEETVADGPSPLPVGGSSANTVEHVAVVVDDVAGALRLYSAGVEVSSVPLAERLAGIEDVNNWLGRSNYFVDPPLFGTLIEFRIYDQALSAMQLDTSFRAGPGALNQSASP